MADRQPRHDPIPALEWAAAALGLIVALVLLGIVGREAIRGEPVGAVPHLSVRVERMVAVPGGLIAEIVVANGSGRTAAAVQVEGQLGEQDAAATIDYVPGHSQAKGGLMFERGDEGAARPRVRVTGYELP